MKKLKSKKLELDRSHTAIKPLEENVLEQVTGGASKPCHENSIIPTGRNCTGCW